MIEPAEPVEKRMELLDFSISMDRKELEKWVSRMGDEGLVPSYYNHARVTLIKLIGSKGAQEYNRREYEELGEEGRARQIEIYKKWEECNRERWEKIEEVAHSMPEPASVHEKIVIIRKGFRGSNGKYMTQRDFAKFLEYPISRYAEAESRTDFGRIELPVEDELIDLLVSKCHANPYWIYDGDGNALMLAVELYDPAAVQYQTLASLGFSYIENPRWKEGYSAGDTFTFSLKEAFGSEVSSTEWLFDGKPVTTPSVKLSAGSHTVTARVKYANGSSEDISLELTVKP